EATNSCDDKQFDATLNQYRQQILSDHNKYRTIHGCASLQLTDRLNRSAQEYAEELASGDSEKL
ncbi:hypothetical protein PFISCL1PPCAC_12866, partial [Pristionchus fissidentatus]